MLRFMSAPSAPDARRDPFPAALFFAAVVVALAYNVIAVGPRAQPTGDALEYDLLGRLLAEGKGFVGTKRTPLFPAFLGAIYGVTGENRFVARVMLSVIAAGLAVIIYRLGRAFSGERAGRAAGIIAAVYPPLFYWSARLNTEIPFAALAAAAMLALARAERGEGAMNSGAVDGPARVPLVVAGILLGLACLTRPAGVFILALLPAWALLAERPARPRPVIRRLGLVLLPALLVILPWTVRNYRVTGHVVPLSTLGGNVLIGSNNPAVAGAPLAQRGTAHAAGAAGGGWVPPDDSGLLSPEDFGRLLHAGEYDRDQLYRRRALEYLRSHPGAWPELAAKKFLRLFEFVPPERGLRELPSLAPYYAVLALAIAGAGITRRSWRRYLPLHLLVVSTVASAILTWGGRRFRVPLEPALLVFAGVAVARALDRWKPAGARPENAPIRAAGVESARPR